MFVPPQPGETYDGFYKRAPDDIRKSLDRLKEDWKSNLKINKKRTLEKILEIENSHHQLIKTCAKAFANTSLSERSGYTFYFVEPLIEKSSKKKGNCIFDLVLYSRSESSAIFIECKSSSKNSCGSIQQIKDAKKLILDNIEYFAEKSGFDLDPSKIEFVECVYFEDSYEIAHTVASQEQNKSNNSERLPEDIKVWEFFQGTEEIRLCNGHRHQNVELTTMLSNRYGGNNVREQFDVPYYLNLHPFFILINIVVTYCYRENLYNDNIIDKNKKVISKNHIYQHLIGNAFFALNQTEIKTELTKLIDRIIKFGIDCDLFEIVDPDHIRIKCQGSKLKIVTENLTKKYLDNWADCKSEERAKYEALEDMKKQFAKIHPTLEDFGLS